MGTNYYVENPLCQHCGRDGERLHIGKSSAGWNFGLHVIPEKGLNDLSDWTDYFSIDGRVIKDEYGRIISPKEMLLKITERKGNIGKQPFCDPFYESLDDLLEKNNAELTDKGLLRAKNDGKHCVGHGAGTWDLIAGDFS